MRARRWLQKRPWVLPLAAFLVAFFAFLEWRLPEIGHDYPPFYQYLFAGRWHFFHQGLRPFRYAVHLCGGMPIYGHPQDMYYSILQLFAFGMSLWRATEITLLVLLLAGYAGWVLLGRDVLRLKGAWAHALALIAVSHGFFFVHVMVGHVNFFTMPMLGLLGWLLLSPDRKGMTLPVRAGCFGLLAAAILYFAGYFTLLFFAAFVLAALPLLLAYRKELKLPSNAALAGRAALLGGVSVLLCASKLTAVWSLMQAFPRTVEAVPLPPGAPAFLLLLRSLWALPQHAGLYARVPWGMHEFSMAISPVVLLGAVAALWLLLSPATKRGSGRRLFTLLYGLLLFQICFELYRGGGASVALLRELPLFSSLRVFSRFLYPFSLLLACGAVVALQEYVGKRHKASARTLAVTALWVTAAAFAVVHAPIVRQLPLTGSLDIIERRERILRERSFTTMRVEEVYRGDSTFLGVTGRVCNEDSLFTWSQQPIRRFLRLGPVTQVWDGHFNLMHPACYAYGAANGCGPGFRIPTWDAANFEAFRSGKPTTWRVSRAQRVADALSLGTLLWILAVAAWRLLHPRARR